MKMLSKIFLFTLLLISALFSLQKQTFAQSIQCADFEVDRRSGDQNTIFTFTANCNNTSATSIRLYIEDSEGNQTGLSLSNVNVTSSGEMNVQVPVDSSIDGTYFAYLLDPNQNLIAGPVTFTVTPSITTKGCCSVTARNQTALCQVDTLNRIVQEESNCVIPSGGADTCPDFCEAISIRTTCSTSSYGEIRICAGVSGDHPSLCQSGSFNEVGVNSAIGCIPFEDINNTTAFFIRWALGVGGGIALFLIALSGIKIATTKGDPKRLQDAKDTLSSAIAGIVMIVLSVFLVRFLSEVLLNLF